MSNRWICPHCGQYVERARKSGEDALICGLCDWTYLRSFWCGKELPDGVMTIVEKGGYSIRGGPTGWIEEQGETEVLVLEGRWLTLDGLLWFYDEREVTDGVLP